MGTIKAPGRERFFNTTNPLPHHALRFKGHFKQSFSSELKTYFEQISSLSKIAMSLDARKNSLRDNIKIKKTLIIKR